jgi:hypothetical protein
MQAGLLGDLYAGRGEEDYRWMVHGRWIFTRTFVLPPDYLKTHSRVQLVCEGLDTLGIALHHSFRACATTAPNLPSHHRTGLYLSLSMQPR